MPSASIQMTFSEISGPPKFGWLSFFSAHELKQIWGFGFEGLCHLSHIDCALHLDSILPHCASPESSSPRNPGHQNDGTDISSSVQ